MFRWYGTKMASIGTWTIDKVSPMEIPALHVYSFLRETNFPNINFINKIHHKPQTMHCSCLNRTFLNTILYVPRPQRKFPWTVYRSKSQFNGKIYWNGYSKSWAIFQHILLRNWDIIHVQKRLRKDIECFISKPNAHGKFWDLHIKISLKINISKTNR